MSSDERLHALGGVRLVCNHHHPISVHMQGTQAALSVTHQAEHSFVKVLVLLLWTWRQTQHENFTDRMLWCDTEKDYREYQIFCSFYLLANCRWLIAGQLFVSRISGQLITPIFTVWGFALRVFLRLAGEPLKRRTSARHRQQGTRCVNPLCLTLTLLTLLRPLHGSTWLLAQWRRPCCQPLQSLVKDRLSWVIQGSQLVYLHTCETEASRRFSFIQVMWNDFADLSTWLPVLLPTSPPVSTTTH